MTMDKQRSAYDLKMRCCKEKAQSLYNPSEQHGYADDTVHDMFA
jgi:hypothetical protein